MSSWWVIEEDQYGVVWLLGVDDMRMSAQRRWEIQVAMEKQNIMVRVWACGSSMTLSRWEVTVEIFWEIKEWMKEGLPMGWPRNRMPVVISALEG